MSLAALQFENFNVVHLIGIDHLAVVLFFGIGNIFIFCCCLFISVTAIGLGTLFLLVAVVTLAAAEGAHVRASAPYRSSCLNALGCMLVKGLFFIYFVVRNLHSTFLV